MAEEEDGTGDEGGLVLGVLAIEVVEGAFEGRVLGRFLLEKFGERLVQGFRRECTWGVGGDEMDFIDDRGDEIEESADIFAFDGGEDDAGFGVGELALPGVEEGFGSVGVVRGVKDDGGLLVFLWDDLEAPRVSYGVHGLADEVGVEREVELVGRFEGEGGVVLLVESGEVDGVAFEGRGDEGEGSAFFAGDLANNLGGCCFLGGGNDGRFGADNASFFGGNGSESVAEPLGVIEPDGGDEGEFGGNGGGGVEASAHTGFEDDVAAVLLNEMPHREGEGEFEEGGVVFPILDEFFKGENVISAGFL